MSSYPDTLVVYAAPSFDWLNPAARGTPVFLRVVVEHRDPEKCSFSLAFAAAPDNLVPWPELLREVGDHSKRCPLMPGGGAS